MVQRLKKIKNEAMHAAISEGQKAGLTDHANILTLAGFIMPLKGMRHNAWNSYVALNMDGIPAGSTLFHSARLQ